MKDHIITCDNCLQDFEPDDTLVFICGDCKNKLNDCPKCGSDDVAFDWQIHEPLTEYIYYYRIGCQSCEYEITESHHLDGGHQAAETVFKKWQGEA